MQDENILPVMRAEARSSLGRKNGRGKLSYLDDGQVLCRGNFHPGHHYQLVSGLEFLAMLVPHMAFRYECRIHCSGAISTTIRRQLGWVKKEETPRAPKDVTIIEEEERQFAKVRCKNWARLISKVWLENPSLCGGFT